MTPQVETEKRLAAEAAAELVENGMTVGLGTGSTVAYLLPALARRNLSLRCVTTSQRTDDAARSVGLHVEAFGGIDHIDIAIDGADQIAPDGWLVKGGGGAHTREKLVAATAERFVVIADSTKPVERIHSPIPLELFLLRAGLHLATTRADHIARRPQTAQMAESSQTSRVRSETLRRSRLGSGPPLGSSSTGSSPPTWSNTSWSHTSPRWW